MRSSTAVVDRDRFGIASLSLGNNAYHTLQAKVSAAAQCGLRHVEVTIPDFEAYRDGCIADGSATDDVSAAKLLHDLLSAHNIRVSCFQPIRDVEGHTDPEKKKSVFLKATTCFPIMKILDCDLLLCCSSVDPSSSPDENIIGRDLAELADLAAAWSKENSFRCIRIGFEALSWGVHVYTWKQSWKCVSASPRENLGIILDSFNSLAREYSDPWTKSGLQRPEEQSKAFLDENMRELMSLPGEKIFLFQIADAMLPPDDCPRPLSTDPFQMIMPWSRNYRLFPLEIERGAILPIEIYAAAVEATGYRGPLSLEVFNTSLSDPNPHTPMAHASRGASSLQRLYSSYSETR